MLPTRQQFLRDIAEMPTAALFAKSNALMDEAGQKHDAAERAELCARILFLDQATAFLADEDDAAALASARRRAA